MSAITHRRVQVGGAPTPPPVTYSIFTSEVPASTTNIDGAPNIQTASAFWSDVPGSITHLRFYQNTNPAGDETLLLWRIDGAPAADTRTFLGSVTALAGTTVAGAFNAVALAVPIPIVANQLYKVSRYNSVGRYVFTAAGFAAAVVNGPLHGAADGSNPTGAGAVHNATFEQPGAPPDGTVYPADSHTGGSACYFADVVFLPA